MNGRRLRVLLVSQRMDRTGAVVQLLTLLPGLREAAGAHLTLLHGSDGVLTASAEHHVDRMVREPTAARAVRRLERRSPRPVARLLRWARSIGLRWRIGRVDVVYVNSLISTELATAFESRRLVLHVHELGELGASLRGRAEPLLRRASVVLVPSSPARDWVIGSGVPPSVVHVLPGAVPDSAFDQPTADTTLALRRRLGIEETTPIVTTVGWIGELKGSDRFLQVASQVAERTGGNVRFLWVGGGAETSAEARFRVGVAELGLERVVRVLSAMDDLRPLYLISDVVLVTSREESLSLVSLEGAAQSTPVVCFPGAGGPDALAEEGVVISPTHDGVDGVVDEIDRLLRSPEARAAAGEGGRDAVRARHLARDSQPILAAALAGDLA